MGVSGYISIGINVQFFVFRGYHFFIFHMMILKIVCEGTTVKHFANASFAVKLTIIFKYEAVNRQLYDTDVTFAP
jgi:hypothetical protein